MCALVFPTEILGENKQYGKCSVEFNYLWWISFEYNICGSPNSNWMFILHSRQRKEPIYVKTVILKVIVIINGILKLLVGVWHTLNIKPSCCRLLDLAFKDWDWSFDDVDDIDDDDDDDDVFDFWRSIRGKSK